MTKFYNENPEATTKIKYDYDWHEYQVELYHDGELVEGATYHTDCKHDAELTAALMRGDA